MAFDSLLGSALTMVPGVAVGIVIQGAVLLWVAYLIYAERRIIAWMQLRQGPNVVGPFGLLQSFADAAKLLFKEKIYPAKARVVVFALAPMLAFGLVMMGWAVIPSAFLQYADSTGAPAVYVLADIDLGVMYLMAISALEVYGLIMAGWASNSKYAFYGAVRSAAQMISYELSLSFAVLIVVAVTGSTNLSAIVENYRHVDWLTKVLIAPMAVVFFIAVLAETNRHPFDLPEAESELVAGYNVEYSSTPFALFFLGEYANMILKSAVTVLLFMGAWYPPLDIPVLYMVPPFIWFFLKICMLLFVFIWIRAALPRYRYDQLMRLGWKTLLPLTFFWLVAMSARVFVMSH
jgi:NADH-quinone oxidoreductase subunit H